MVFSVPPSPKRLGNDGDWSTFTILVGAPAQEIEVLPATSLQYTIVVKDQGCTVSDPENCKELRGGLLDMSSLIPTGWHGVRMTPENPDVELSFGAADLTLKKRVSAEMGTTLLSLKWEDIGVNEGPLVNQLVAAYHTQEPFIGLLGLSGWERCPVNDTSYPNLMSGLSNTSSVSSMSWGYTAGVKSNSIDVPGSLAFGGYDSSRVMMGNSLTNITLGKAGIGQELSLAIKGISFGADSTEQEPESVDVNVLLDSMVPDIWLPDPICDIFARQFGLEWNDTAKMYFLNDTQRQMLNSEDMFVTFNLTTSINESTHIAVRLPYSAFDHVVKFPLDGIQENTTVKHYFPLKKSGDEAYNFLGRTFFQGAYVSVDYERGVFNVSQALLQPSGPAELVAIVSPSAAAESKPEPGQDNTLGAAAIAGISIGGFAVLSFLVALIWWRRHSRKKRTPAIPPHRLPRVMSTDETTLADVDMELTNIENFKPPPQELHGGPSDGASEAYAKPELDATTRSARHELATGGSHRPGHRRQQQSFGSSQSGISPMGVGDRTSGMFGEPSPPLDNNSPRPSPPLPGGRFGVIAQSYPFELE